MVVFVSEATSSLRQTSLPAIGRADEGADVRADRGTDRGPDGGANQRRGADRSADNVAERSANRRASSIADSVTDRFTATFTHSEADSASYTKFRNHIRLRRQRASAENAVQQRPAVHAALDSTDK